MVTFDDDEPIEKVLATVEEAYGVRVKVFDPDEDDDDAGAGSDLQRTKQDRT